MSRSVPRRSRLDVRFGRFLQIGQQWRRHDDGTVWAVRQIHRQDCIAEIALNGDKPRAVAFSVLRTEYRWIADSEREVAA